MLHSTGKTALTMACALLVLFCFAMPHLLTHCQHPFSRVRRVDDQMREAARQGWPTTFDDLAARYALDPGAKNAAPIVDAVAARIVDHSTIKRLSQPDGAPDPRDLVQVAERERDAIELSRHILDCDGMHYAFDINSGANAPIRHHGRIWRVAILNLIAAQAAAHRGDGEAACTSLRVALWLATAMKEEPLHNAFGRHTAIMKSLWLYLPQILGAHAMSSAQLKLLADALERTMSTRQHLLDVLNIQRILHARQMQAFAHSHKDRAAQNHISKRIVEDLRTWTQTIELVKSADLVSLAQRDTDVPQKNAALIISRLIECRLCVSVCTAAVIAARHHLDNNAWPQSTEEVRRDLPPNVADLVSIRTEGNHCVVTSNIVPAFRRRLSPMPKPLTIRMTAPDLTQ